MDTVILKIFGIDLDEILHADKDIDIEYEVDSEVECEVECDDDSGEGDNPPVIVYISGKMRGLQNNGRELFDEVEHYLKGLGCIVINPARLPDGLDPESYMPICTAMIDAADCIYMLDNWKDSAGAQAEYHYARCQQKIVLFDSDNTERSHHNKRRKP